MIYFWFTTENSTPCQNRLIDKKGWNIDGGDGEILGVQRSLTFGAGLGRHAARIGFEFRAPGCEFVRAAIKGELWNESTNGIASRLPGARNMMDSKGR
jgi:hypothetical protein